MVGLTRYSVNSYIIKDVDSVVSEKLFNIIFNELLVKRNEIQKNDKEIQRVKRYGNFVMVDGYGSVNRRVLEEFIMSFLNNTYIEFEQFTLTDPEKEFLKPFLPIISKRKGDQCGGTRNDTSYLDPNVAPLCKALASFDGIKTFSSCEGHPEYNGQANFYVLFTVENQESLNKLTKELWQGLELVHDKYERVPHINLMFDYGHWESVQKTYYEIRIPYQKNQQGLVFESMKYLADYLKEKKNNV
jgi:hypothetical protein